MRLAMMTAAGSRAAAFGIGADLGVRAVACLRGFPAIIVPIWKDAPRPAPPAASQADVFQF
jgi:hypothetical protein